MNLFLSRCTLMLTSEIFGRKVEKMRFFGYLKIRVRVVASAVNDLRWYMGN